jgi:adenosylcobyric acid synthase
MATHDVVVIEGAGSPTEINLMASDLVNLKVARASGAATLLICDIDRGGAFAHLYGTWHFMPEPDRRALRGFILNRFRGDSSLLEPGPEMIQAATGVPVLSVLPWWREHGLPEEDAVIALPRKGIRSLYRVFIVAYPAISNHDEFQSLHQQPGIDCIWVRDRSVLAGLQPHDWIILPGSKQTQGDLAWLKHMGLDVVIQHHAETGGVVLGICGGLQMLGMTLQDPLGVEQEGFSEGLGLLPLETTFEVEKTVSRATYRFDHLRGPWMPLSGLRVTGYEIHQGRTVMISGRESPELLPGSVYQNEAGNILGLYLHGLFESPEVLRVFFGLESRTLDDIFEGLADFLVEHGGRETWLSLLEPKP